MTTRTPLTLTEAKTVAEQIRTSTVVDQEYWPWVIEELCLMHGNGLTESSIESIAKFAYEQSVRRYGINWLGKHRWEDQNEALKNDWLDIVKLIIRESQAHRMQGRWPTSS